MAGNFGSWVAEDNFDHGVLVRQVHVYSDGHWAYSIWRVAWARDQSTMYWFYTKPTTSGIQLSDVAEDITAPAIKEMLKNGGGKLDETSGSATTLFLATSEDEAIAKAEALVAGKEYAGTARQIEGDGAEFMDTLGKMWEEQHRG